MSGFPIGPLRFKMRLSWTIGLLLIVIVSQLIETTLQAWEEIRTRYPEDLYSLEGKAVLLCLHARHLIAEGGSVDLIQKQIASAVSIWTQLDKKIEPPVENSFFMMQVEYAQSLLPQEPGEK